MNLDPQKNFYDEKRYFQGKDNPGDAHPDSATREPLPRGQIVFGLVFLGFIAFLALLNIKSARQEMNAKPPAAAAPANPLSNPVPATK
jgi:hypothetical protein